MKLKFIIGIIVFIFSVLIGFGGMYFCMPEPDKRPPEQKVVQVGIFCGLGNNMFQYATALAYSLEYNKKLYVEGDTFKLTNAFDIQLNTPEHEDVPVWTNLKNKKVPFKGIHFSDDNKGTFYDNDKYIYFFGYFQNEKYFKKYRSEILKAFRFKKGLSDTNKKLIKQIQSHNSISVHIRRGDYLYSENAQHVLPLYYYKIATEYMAERVENPHFYIFSDDIAWVKENLKIPYPHTFVEHNQGNYSYNDMRLMSLCKHNIIANSTFSWWGAWLNENPHKIVVAPDIWLKHRPEFVNQIVSEDWVKLPTRPAKVAILHIATGRYIVFFDEFYQSMEKNFLPYDDKTYFVWTDSKRKFPDNVVRIDTPNLGFPKATLYRYNLFQQAWGQLKDFDYMYFLNANMLAIRPVGHEIFPTNKQGIMATLHPGYYKTKPPFPYDRNPRSTAYIQHTPPPHASIQKQEYYYMGGFNGGTAKAFKKLIDTIALNVITDEKNGVMALWHDESHLNKYLHDKNPLILPPSYGYPSTPVGSYHTHFEFDGSYKLYIQNKSDPKWGGHRYLRGETDTPNE